MHLLLEMYIKKLIIIQNPIAQWQTTFLFCTSASNIFIHKYNSYCMYMYIHTVKTCIYYEQRMLYIFTNKGTFRCLLSNVWHLVSTSYVNLLIFQWHLRVFIFPVLYEEMLMSSTWKWNWFSCLSNVPKIHGL